MNSQKKTFETLFLFLTILLAVLPVVLTFNDVITHVVERFVLYTYIQDHIVPFQAQLVGILLGPLGVSYIAYKDGMMVNHIPIRLSWNCLGWQSLLLFGISAYFALKSTQYKNLSKIKAIIIGLIGIFWINILRITFTTILAIKAMPLFRIVFHDYLSAIVTIVYLLFFWWFSYAYILEEKAS